jgi:hypothetical protein
MQMKTKWRQARCLSYGLIPRAPGLFGFWTEEPIEEIVGGWLVGGRLIGVRAAFKDSADALEQIA